MLCGRSSGCCPEVTVYDNGNVNITDNDQDPYERQGIEFTPKQWETLRMKILSGEL